MKARNLVNQILEAPEQPKFERSAYAQQRDKAEQIVRALADAESRLRDAGADEETLRQIHALVLKKDQEMRGIKNKTTAAPGEGAMLVSMPQLRKILADQTGYAGWQAEKDLELKEELIDSIESEFSISVDPKTAVAYRFTRDAHNRSELYHMTFLLWPGHVFVGDYDTDRVGASVDEIVTSVDELKKALTS
jgi:hypothetical protein